jgi:hypothetical protein
MKVILWQGGYFLCKIFNPHQATKKTARRKDEQFYQLTLKLNQICLLKHLKLLVLFTYLLMLLDDYDLHIFILILMAFFTILINLDIESISIIALHHNHMFTMRMISF